MPHIKNDRERQREACRKYYYNNLEKERERNRLKQHRFYRDRPEHMKVIAKRSRDKAKLEILTHYGLGKCQCVECGEGRIACLSIDHINGNGVRQRKQLKAHGSTFYIWLRRNNFPNGYQTLCMNCQWIKRDNKGEVKGHVQ